LIHLGIRNFVARYVLTRSVNSTLSVAYKSKSTIHSEREKFEVIWMIKFKEIGLDIWMSLCYKIFQQTTIVIIIIIISCMQILLNKNYIQKL